MRNPDPRIGQGMRSDSHGVGVSYQILKKNDRTEEQGQTENAG
jgi:hypothetical protein